MTTTFDAAPVTVPKARHTVMARLIQAGCAIETIETAALLTTELAANAVQHAAGGGGYTVEVDVDLTHVHVEVRDGDRRLPLRPLREPADAESGRGLSIVDTFASRWGVRPVDAGKVVWFDLALGAAPSPS
jgi:anti-sigma regulatory factor (Ser/Thr protein kinase)